VVGYSKGNIVGSVVGSEVRGDEDKGGLERGVGGVEEGGVDSGNCLIGILVGGDVVDKEGPAEGCPLGIELGCDDGSPLSDTEG